MSRKWFLFRHLADPSSLRLILRPEESEIAISEIKTPRSRQPAGSSEAPWINPDLILPGDIKDLTNKVTAKKAAEANLIARREETAAMRSQADTAKLLKGNPTLMWLRELEVLEKVATSGKLNVVLGEQSLAERGVNLRRWSPMPGDRKVFRPSGFLLGSDLSSTCVCMENPCGKLKSMRLAATMGLSCRS